MTSIVLAKRALAITLALLSAPPVAHAQGGPALPLWELGAIGMGVAQQAYPGSAARVDRWLVLPFLVYRGRILRVDRESAGLRALKTPDFELDLGVAGAFGAHSSDVAARRGMPDLGTLVEIGPRLKWRLGAESTNRPWRAEFPLRGVFDLNDHLAHKGLAFEPTLLCEPSARGGWATRVNFGAVIGDRRLNHAFYGVAPSESTAQRPAYNARAGLIAWRLGSAISYRVTPNLRLFGFARLDSVAGAANNASPLVDRRTGLSAGLGLNVTLKRSQSTTIF